jgi:hypothetical protein
MWFTPIKKKLMGIKNKKYKELFNNISMPKLTAYQKLKQLPAAERAAIQAEKYAIKAAKSQRRLLQVARKSPKKPKPTPQEIFNKNPNASWETVECALNVANTDVQSLYKNFEEYRDSILSVTRSDRLPDIDFAINKVDAIKMRYESATTTPTLANDLLKTTRAFQAELGTVSAYTEKCQPVPLPDQERLNHILRFYTEQKERLVTCKNQAIGMLRQKDPANLVECFIGMFPQSGELNNLILCVIIKLLFGGMKFVEPTCETAIYVRNHLYIQDRNQRNVDGSIAAQARNCADNTGCPDCTGVQAWNIVRHHEYMCARAIKKMLISLLNGRETALEAFWKFLEMECEHKFNSNPSLFGRYSSLIVMFIPQFHKKLHPDFQRFSEEQRGEIAKMMLGRCGMTIEEVKSRITAFLTKPPE